MTGVQMVHPDLPGQRITVPDPVATVIYERSGWRLENVADQPEWHLLPERVQEGHVVIVHPGTGQTTTVTPEALGTLRASGWLLQSEAEENEREAAARSKRPPKDGGKDKAEAAVSAAAEED